MGLKLNLNIVGKKINKKEKLRTAKISGIFEESSSKKVFVFLSKLNPLKNKPQPFLLWRIWIEFLINVDEAHRTAINKVCFTCVAASSAGQIIAVQPVV